MSRAYRYLTRLGVAALVLLAAGCPRLGDPPQLRVSPQSLVLDAEVGVANFYITNGGGRTLSWEVSEDIPWLTLTERAAAKQDSDAGPIRGTTGSETDTIDMVIRRDALSLGLNQGWIEVTSDAGTQSVAVSTTVTSAAALAVTPENIDLGVSLDTASFTIANDGGNRLDWTASVAGGSGSWLSVLEQSGSIAAGGPVVQVGLAADRSSLASGTYTETVNVASNGGNASIAVSITVESLVFDPASLDFGALLGASSRFVRLQNTSAAAVAVDLSVVEQVGSGWLSLAGDSVTVPGGGQYDIAVTADPDGLAPGLYQGELRVSAPAAGFEAAIPVSMEVARFVVTPTAIDLGTVTTTTSATVTLQNVGGEAVDWSLAGSSLNAPWLSATPVSGTVAANGMATVEVAVDPALLDAGVHEVSFAVVFTGGEAEITLGLVRPRDAALMLGKSDYAFETVRAQASNALDILHAGDLGTINWSISTAGFPDWLRLEGALSGVLNPEGVATVSIVVDRALAPADGGLFLEHTFEVVGSGDFTGTLPVHVSMRTPSDPRIEIEADGLDQTGRDFVNIDVDEDARSFIVRNVGDAPLLWRLDPEQLPSWITSVSPAQSTLDPNIQQTVTINVDRTGLDYAGDQTVLTITSDDPDRPTVSLLVEIQVPKVILIGTRQSDLSYGLTLTSGILEVANVGDPDTELNFQVTASKEWLSVFPDTGKSIGVSGPFKDYVAVSVTVDRAQLEGGGASAKLTISAYTRENGQNVPRDDVDPVEVNVSVVAAELSFEVAQPRIRIPSLVRYEVLMRNKRFQPIPLADARLEEVAPLFGIVEQDVALEPAETNQFLTPSAARNVRTSVLVLLDYSGSMLAAAEQLVQDGQLPAGAAADPLQAMYEYTVSRLLEELPATWDVALAVFNERQSGGLRVIAPAADGAPMFTRDKAVLQARLEGIDVVDHGATELLPAFEQAAVVLDENDGIFIPFDDSSMRLLLCVTDGRMTTPPGEIAQTIDLLSNTRVRLFAVGWGDQVAADPLIRVATASGGHYYATKTRDTGDRDAFGAPIRVPLLRELLGWCMTDPLTDLGGEMAAAFAALDGNGDGSLSLDEALAYVPAVSPAEFAQLDVDTSGLLDLAEARGKYRHLTQADFDALDGDGNGGLNLDESQGVLPALTVDDFASTLDADLDGAVTPQELAAAIACDQSLARDLESQIVLSYVTLNESASVTVEAELTFNDPNDQNSPCLTEQGEITGSFSHSLLNFAAVTGDPRLGQVGLIASGRDADGSPVVTVRAEYIPRNVTQLAFQITSAQPFTVSQVPPLSGGIIHGWTPSFSAANDTWTYTSPDGTPLQFATFGDLLDIRFDPGAPASFDLDFQVATPVYTGQPDGKYFTHPDRITVTDAGFHATSFPRHELTGTPALLGDIEGLSVTLGTDVAELRVDVHNFGGSHEPTGVGLGWELISGAGAARFLDVNRVEDVDLPNGISGFITTCKTPDTFYVVPDRANLVAGEYSVDFYVSYLYGTLGLVSDSPMVTVYFEVLPPALTVSTSALDFGTDLVDLPITISNTGQGTLYWQLDQVLFPFWLDATVALGDLGPDDDVTFNIRVDRSAADPGVYSFPMTLSTDAPGGDRTIDVTMEVAGP